MLCEASSMVAPLAVAVMLETAAHPVGGVGIERGGRFVEQQHVGMVEQRLGDRHAGLLAGADSLPVGRSMKFGQLKFLRERVDARFRIRDAIEPANRPSDSAAR